MSDIPQRERLPPEQRPTLAQLAMHSRGEPMQIGGRPADVCPYCGCGLFAANPKQPATLIIRYRYCRNPACGKRFVSTQPPETLSREIIK